MQQLGIGTAHTSSTPTIESLISALEQTLQPEVTTHAQSIAIAMRSDGALVAAQRLLRVTA